MSEIKGHRSIPFGILGKFLNTLMGTYRLRCSWDAAHPLMAFSEAKNPYQPSGQHLAFYHYPHVCNNSSPTLVISGTIGVAGRPR